MLLITMIHCSWLKLELEFENLDSNFYYDYITMHLCSKKKNLICTDINDNITLEECSREKEYYPNVFLKLVFGLTVFPKFLTLE